MKVELIVIFCSFLSFSKACAGDNNKSDVKKIIQMGHDCCVKESGVNEDLVNQAIADQIFVNNPKLKCYMYCLFTHFKVIDKDTGKATISTFEKSYPKEFVNKYYPVFKNCKVKDFKNKDRCEEAWKYATTCFVNQPNYTFL